jgi:CHAT domain-containing protein
VGADALSGLARAFFLAGARAMLVSHWAVYSDAAVELTTRTFANLAREPGAGRAEAFRQSMLTLIGEGRPPSYWAPFVIVGEGGPAS